MTVMMPGKFAERKTRPYKRSLSSFEKSSIPDTTRRALVLPGAPNTEVEELVEAGFNPCFIYGVEHDPIVFRELHDHYRDSAHIFYDDIFNWINFARGVGCYAYVHLDMCGHLNSETASKMQQATRLMAPTARIRMSTFRGRRMPLQFDFEALLQEELLLRWCRIGFDLDESNPDRWVDFHQFCSEHLKDTTRAIVAIWTLNFFFGVSDWREYRDDCVSNGEYLPTVQGSHQIHSIQRWSYTEPGSKNHMYTVWADLSPLPEDPLRDSTQWILNSLAKIFQDLNHVTPNFTVTN